MNWRNRYLEPRVGSKVKIIDDSEIKSIPKYPTLGETVTLIKLKENNSDENKILYHFDVGYYLFRNEFEVVG